MKPDFALNLSHEGAELLHRAAAGWERLGAVCFDQPDLDTALAALREAAGARAPDGLFTKLVIPASELRYATVLAPGPTDEARRLQIESEIEGLTPYGIDELVYDYVVEGDYALVVLAAREILDEAEAFAVNHGLNPVAFVAIPEKGAFHGEPFLGETRAARSLLPVGEAVVADAQPVQPGDKPAAADQRAAPEPVSGGGARATPAARTAQPPQPPVANRPAAARPKVEITPKARPAGGSGFPAQAADDGGQESGGLARMGDLVRRMGNRLRRERADGEGAGRKVARPNEGTAAGAAAGGRPGSAAEGAAPQQAKPEQRKPEKPPMRFRSAPPRAGDKGETAPRKSESGTDPAMPGTPGAGGKKKKADADVGRAGAAPLAFSSRRKPGPGPSPQLASGNDGARSKRPGPGGRLAMLSGAGREGRRTAALGSIVRGAGRQIRDGLQRLGIGGKALTERARRADKSRPAAPPRASETGNGLVSPGRQGKAARRGGADAPIVPASRPPADEAAKATEAEALTIFGARGNKQPQPLVARKGLMAAGGVFLLLGAVAVWALFFDLGTGEQADPELAQVAPENGIEAPAALTEATPGSDFAPAPAEPETTDPVATDDPATDDPEALLEELVRDGLREAAPAEILDDVASAPADVGTDTQTDAAAIDGAADQGVGPAEPAQPGDAPSLAEAAPAYGAQRLALPAPFERPSLDEVMPVSAPPPPPFGVEFDLGEDGLVAATPEGALSPRGILVHAGRPDAVPPTRPVGLAPVQTEDAEAEPEAAEAPAEPEAAPEPDDAPRADPALAEARPQPRSARVAAMAEAAAAEEAAEAEAEDEGLTTPDAAEDAAAPETEPEAGDSSALTPPGGIAFAALRPQQRPTDLVPPTRAATADEINPADATEEAVARSLLPSARPEDMSERVREALAAARDSGGSARQRVRGGDAPQLPTAASVAERATESGLNLRRINLIGVYGTASDRRALVRLSDGRIVRVGVGDNLDGGQVSAIGDSELRYTRRGRNEVLRIGGRG